MDADEAQDILDRIEDEMSIPSEVVHDMDRDTFEEFIETWADLKEAELDERPHISDRFISRLDDER